MTKATCRCAYFNYYEYGYNFSILIDVDTDDAYMVKSDWMPPIVDEDLLYNTWEEFDITFNILGQREDKHGRLSTEIEIISEG